jgi:hypothetical protein
VASNSHVGASLEERRSRRTLRQTVSGGLRPPTPGDEAIARPPSFGSTHLLPSQISSGRTTPRSRRSSRRTSQRTSQRTTPLTTQQLPLNPPTPIEVEKPEPVQENIEVDVPNPEELNQYWGSLIERPLTRPPRDPLEPNPLASAGQGLSQQVEQVDRDGTWTPEDLNCLVQEQSLATLSLRIDQRPHINFDTSTERIIFNPNPTADLEPQLQTLAQIRAEHARLQEQNQRDLVESQQQGSVVAPNPYSIRQQQQLELQLLNQAQSIV